jgi:hypothetical protein
MNSYQNLIDESKKLNDSEHNLLMDKFKKLNEQYNNENIYFNNSEYKYDILNSSDEDIFNIIDKAKNELNIVNEDIQNISVKLEKYNKILEEINIFRGLIETVNKKYYDISVESKNIYCNNILPITKYYCNSENEKYLDLLKNELELNINKLNSDFTEKSNKIIRFRKLILKATSSEKLINICTVCATNKIDICINSCGHTFCKLCVDKMNKCCMCRGNIISKIKIYIDNDKDDEINNILPFSDNMNMLPGIDNDYLSEYSSI